MKKHNKTYKRKNPKQNFEINTIEIFNCKELGNFQQRILIQILINHKANCKYGFTHLLNVNLANSLWITIDTMIKHRRKLIQNKYFETKKKRTGRSYVLTYHPNWTKLRSLNLIIEHQKIEKDKERENKKNNYKPEYNSSNKRTTNSCSLKKGDIITLESLDSISDEVVYSIKTFSIENGERSSNGNEDKKYGKDLKRFIKATYNNLKHGGELDCEITYLKTIN